MCDACFPQDMDGSFSCSVLTHPLATYTGCGPDVSLFRQGGRKGRQERRLTTRKIDMSRIHEISGSRGEGRDATRERSRRGTRRACI